MANRLREGQLAWACMSYAVGFAVQTISLGVFVRVLFTESHGATKTRRTGTGHRLWMH